jgi:cysteine desulfurase
MLSERGVYASSGAACSSGAFKESAVIAAIGNPDDGVWGTVRFSIARTTTASELKEAVSVIVEAAQKAMEVMSSTAV